MIIHSLLTFLA